MNRLVSFAFSSSRSLNMQLWLRSSRGKMDSNVLKRDLIGCEEVTLNSAKLAREKHVGGGDDDSIRSASERFFGRALYAHSSIAHTPRQLSEVAEPGRVVIEGARLVLVAHVC